MFFSNSHEVDVDDGFWGLKILMTNFGYWRQELPSLSLCQQHLSDPLLWLLILFSYLRRLLHKKSGRWIWCCPLLQAFIKKDWEGESCSISFYIHCLLHLLLGLLYGLVKWTSNMDWQPKNNILRTRGWIWERIASWISWSNIRRTQQNL